MSGAVLEEPLPCPIATGAQPDRRWVLIIALAGAALLTIACRQMQFSPDSIHYADVARTLLREHTAATWHLTLNSQRVPDPQLYWPPGYPLLLATVMATGASVQTAAWVVAVVSWTGTLVLMVFWLRHAEWGLAGAIAFIYLIFVCGVAFRAWSEAPYSALMLGAVVCLAMALTPEGAQQSFAAGLAAGVLAGAATLIRYPGFALIAGLALVTLVAPIPGKRAMRIRAARLLSLLAGAALVVGPWVARNLALTGTAFGPERPVSTRAIPDIFAALGRSVYLDFGAILLALLFAAVGYHAARRGDYAEDPPPDRVFLRTLAIAGLLCAVAQIVLTLLTYAIWQVDEPPGKRHFFPSYLCALMAGMALIDSARPPTRALRRRWPELTMLLLPLLLAPLLAERASTDVTPRRTALEAWVEANTAPNALIIGHRVWPVRFFTGRPVLESGQVADPSIYDGLRVAQFLRAFGDRFDGAFVLVPDTIPEPERAAILAGYRAAGLHLDETADVSTQAHDRPRELVVGVYRVGW
ncbi:MAG: hypothetical protein AB7Y46_00790 [Armatimonadota bacterium]